MARVAASGRVSIATGPAIKNFSYMGNGQDNRIIDVGFSPHLVIIKSGTGGNSSVWRSSNFSASPSCAFTESAVAHSTTAIKTFVGSGFTLGTAAQANSAGVPYHGIAIRDETGLFMTTGTYAGNSTDSRTITTGFEPAFVMIKQNGANVSVYRDSLDATNANHAGGATADFTSGSTFKSFSSTGFIVGTSVNANQTGSTYDWFAFALSDFFKVLSFTGDGLDDRNIATLGLTPSFAWTKVSSQIGVARWETMQGDLSAQLTAVAPAANGIQALISGGVQVGTLANVNNSGSTVHLFGWAKNAPRLVATNRASVSGRVTI